MAVTVRALDVSHRDAVDALIAELAAGHHPLRGVVHAAMVLDDAALTELDAERLARVMAPKARGAWHLHQATLDQPLDFFVLCSSISAAVGNPGQGNYVAANAFLDALAEWRRRQGLPALSIGWGVLQDTGVLARSEDVRRHLERQGLTGMSNADALGTLGRLMALGAPSKLAAVVDWATWVQRSHGSAWSPRFERLVESQGRDLAGSQVQQLRRELVALPEGERLAHLARRLVGAVAGVLGIEVPRVSADQSLDQLGVDSLTVVEVAARFEEICGTRVQPLSLLGGHSIARITARLLPDILEGAEPETVAGSGTQPAASGPRAQVPIEERCRYLAEVIERGGPTPDEWDDLNAWGANLIRDCEDQLYTLEDLRAVQDVAALHFPVTSAPGLILHKPHGYPGDFELIDRIYRRLCLVDASKRWDDFVYEHPGARAVRNRKDYFKEVFTGAARGREKLDILNVACGPCRDLSEWMEEARPGDGVSIQCLDQDPDALQFARSVLGPHAERVRFVNEDIRNWHPEDRFDLIWSAGLFDYLDDEQFVQTLERFLSWTRPGGTVVIGNFSPENPSHPWMTILDWILIYRSETHLIEIARRCGVPRDRISVGREPLGINLFLHVKV